MAQSTTLNSALFEKTFDIAGRPISDRQSAFIIAELSGNHGQNFERALGMLRAAAEAGVDAVKLQTYTADTLTLDSRTEDFVIGEQDNLWRGESLHELYARAATPWEWHADLFDYAQELGVMLFSSPFDESSVAFLEQFDPPAYKIASFELNHAPLLRAVAETGKPVILSTGMASLGDIEQAMQKLAAAGCRQMALLQCTSAYPAPERDAHLSNIVDLQRRMQIPVGLSDHSQGLDVAKIALARGAQLIERHLVMAGDEQAVDREFSSTPEQFAELVDFARRVPDIIGEVRYGPADSEQNSLRYRRSIYCARAIAEGEVFSRDNLRVVRPAHGLDPQHWDSLLGQTARCAIEPGTALSWDMVAGAPHAEAVKPGAGSYDVGNPGVGNPDHVAAKE